MEEQQKERLQEKVPIWIKTWIQWSNQNQSFLNKFREKQIPDSSLYQIFYFHQIYQKWVQHLSVPPEKSVDFQLIYWQELFFIWQDFMRYQSAVNKGAPSKKSFFYFIKEAYLLHLRHLQGLLPFIERLNEKTKQALYFNFKQMMDVLASTPVATNPKGWWDALEAQTQHLLKKLNRILSAADSS